MPSGDLPHGQRPSLPRSANNIIKFILQLDHLKKKIVMDETNSEVQWNPVYKVTNGPKQFYILTRIFYQGKVLMAVFARRPKKSGRNNDVAVRRGLTVPVIKDASICPLIVPIVLKKPCFSYSNLI